MKLLLRKANGEGCIRQLKDGRWEARITDGYDEFGKQQREVTDKIKKEYCAKNNIELIEIKYDEDIISSLKHIIKTHNVLHDNPVLSAK